MNEDRHLIDAALAGSRDAFGQLVARYQGRLCSALVYITGSVADAEDVAQDTFLLAFRKLDQFQQRCAFYSWLYRIALNQWISRKRRTRPRVSLQQAAGAALLEPTDPADSPQRQMERGEQIQRVHRALAELDVQHRTILVLREMEGCDYDQIGDILEIPIGTVRSRLHRARQQLRERLLQLMSQEIS